jgi:hypothetical protein
MVSFVDKRNFIGIGLSDTLSLLLGYIGAAKLPGNDDRWMKCVSYATAVLGPTNVSADCETPRRSAAAVIADNYGVEPLAFEDSAEKVTDWS